MKKISTLAIAGISFTCFLGATKGCSDANVVSENISTAADNFEINRRVVFYNGITGEYILQIEGRCSLDPSDKKLTVTVKTGDNEYKKHYLGISDNVTYFAEQIDSVAASPYHYRVVFKPSIIVPSVEIR
jgi:hypothetical protein